MTGGRQDPQSTLAEALRCIERFGGDDLTGTIGRLEVLVKGRKAQGWDAFLSESKVTAELLSHAKTIKRAMGQINVVVHALGILLAVPRILEEGETIESVSLGAGNTGRPFDLETDRRVAEFKFIHWRGGAETIRQNSLFKDFYQLAESETPKRKQLYVIDTLHPLKFLRGGRAISSVLSRNVKLKSAFEQKFQFRRVAEYFGFRQNDVEIIDAAKLVPELAEIAAVVDSAEEDP